MRHEILDVDLIGFDCERTRSQFLNDVGVNRTLVEVVGYNALMCVVV